MSTWEAGGTTRGRETSDPLDQRLRYQQDFEFALDAAVVTDPRGVILEANHAAAFLLSCRKEFLGGKPLGLFVANGHRAGFYDCLARVGVAGGADEFETRVGRREGARDVVVRVVAGEGHGGG